MKKVLIKMKILLLFLLFCSSLSAKNLDIYMLNPENNRGEDGLTSLIEENGKNNDIIAIDFRNGQLVFRGNSTEFIDELDSIFGGKKLVKHNIPYALRTVYKTILPSDYQNINLYMINSILYKDRMFDFGKGIPSDSFLASKKADFVKLNDFGKFKIKTYIFNDRKVFINSEHKDRLRRFYAILCDRLNLNLQAFNTNFSTKKENIKLDKLQANADIKKLRVYKKPPKMLHFDFDEIDSYVYGDKVKVTITNPDRANMQMYIKLNGVQNKVKCDKQGKCVFSSILRLGKNKLSFNRLDGSVYEKEYVSKYIPNDEFKCVATSDNMFILRATNSLRPEGDTVKLKYIEENKTYKAKMTNGFYEFKIPMLHIKNEFQLTQYNGSISACIGTNQELKKKEDERIAKEKKEYEARLAKQLAKQEKLKKKMAEERKKTRINIGQNKVIMDEEILVNNYSEWVETKESYPMDLNEPRKIDSFTLIETDADYDKNSANTFSIYLIDEYGNEKPLALDVPGSNDQSVKTHVFDNPYRNFEVIRIKIVPNLSNSKYGNMNGKWQLDKASIKYLKD